MLRAGSQGPTPPDRHQHNNDLVLLNYRDTKPDLFARLLEQSTPDERAEILERIRRAEQRRA